MCCIVDVLIASFTIFSHFGGTDGTVGCASGGDGGDLSALLMLLPGQFVNRLNVRAGGYMANVAITISDGRSVGGGGGGGDPHDWSVPSASFVLGFSGRSGRYLDQLQATYATINAAKWQ